STRRDYTWVDDIVAGVLAACDAPLRWDVINLGGAQTTSLAELVHLLEETLGVKAVLDRRPPQPGDVPLTSADVTHAAEVLGYALVPAVDHLAAAQPEREWRSAVLRRVELLSVGEPARVVHGDLLAPHRLRAGAHHLVLDLQRHV